MEGVTMHISWYHKNNITHLLKEKIKYIKINIEI